jgi:hypothetical protein
VGPAYDLDREGAASEEAWAVATEPIVVDKPWFQHHLRQPIGVDHAVPQFVFRQETGQS